MMAVQMRLVLMAALLLAPVSCSQRSKPIVSDALVGAEETVRIPLLTVTEVLEGEPEAAGWITVMDDGSFCYRTTGLFEEGVAGGVLSEDLMGSLRADIRAYLIHPEPDGSALYTVDLDRPHAPASIEALLKQVDRRYSGR
jgi:hypothetical protein